jgi:hypothetical protein
LSWERDGKVTGQQPTVCWDVQIVNDEKTEEMHDSTYINFEEMHKLTRKNIEEMQKWYYTYDKIVLR